MKHKMTKIGPGRYLYRDRYLVLTHWDGPRGGVVPKWEIGHADKYGAVCLDGFMNYPTRRAAAIEIDDQYNYRLTPQENFSRERNLTCPKHGETILPAGVCPFDRWPEEAIE